MRRTRQFAGEGCYLYPASHRQQHLTYRSRYDNFIHTGLCFLTACRRHYLPFHFLSVSLSLKSSTVNVNGVAQSFVMLGASTPLLYI